MLLKLTQCSDHANLPELCLALASRKKGESECMIVEKAMATTAQAMGSFIRPKATPGHVMVLKTFKLVGDQHYEVGHGILPFLLVPPGAMSPAARKQAAEDQQRADAFDANQHSDNAQGGVNVSEINKMRNLKGMQPWSGTRGHCSSKQCCPCWARCWGSSIF